MISNQILQSTIEGIKNISRVELCVTDVEGKVLVTTFPEVEISQNDIIKFFAAKLVTFKNTLVTVPMKSFSLPLLAGSI